MLGDAPGGSGLRRWFTLATGLVECLCFAGVVFGWASLVFVLKTEGYFSSLCVNATVNGTQGLDCSEQDEQFSLVFTIASFMNNFLTLPNGYLFDRFGTTVARLLAMRDAPCFGSDITLVVETNVEQNIILTPGETFIYTIGSLMVAFSSSVLSLLLFPALSFIAVGGILFLMTNMQVGNLFGSRRSTIITLYNGAFDSSSAMFLIIKLLFEGGVSLRYSFTFLAACGCIHLLRTFLLLPKDRIPHPLPDDYTYGLTCGKSKTFNLEQDAVERNIQQNFIVEEKLVIKDVADEKSFRQCVLSQFFVWQLLWLSVMQLRHYLFIGTLNPMLQRLTDGEPALVSQYTNAFAMTQLCGVLCAPWNGLIIDRHKRKALGPGVSDREADLQSSVLSLFLTVLQCVLFSVCASIRLLPLQYLTFVLQVLNRSFLYGGNAAFISIAFPSRHFGKLYGLIMALSAVFSLLQYPCFALIKGVFGGDPMWVNIGLILLSIVAFIHPVNVYLHCKRRGSHKVT